MSVLDVPAPAFMLETEIQMFADAASRFFARAAPAERIAGWRAAGQVEREFWRETGAAGFLGVTVPEQYGGPGADFRHDLVLLDVVARQNLRRSQDRAFALRPGGQLMIRGDFP
jgi:long-chain-acyl-CoA dehydrogenase